MAYRMVSFDAAAGSAMPFVANDEEGIAVTIRRKDKPVGFVLCSRSVDPAQLIDDGTAGRLLVEAMREELPVCRDVSALGRLSMTAAICTKDRPARLQRCLESLVSLDSGALGSFEILVVDNASATDETRSIVQRWPAVRYVREPLPGLNFARNLALREARGDFVAFLDDDVIVDSGWLRALSEAWLEYPQAALFTGQVLPLELETPAQLLFEQRGGFRRGFGRAVFGRSRAGDRFYPCKVDIFGTGANMALRRNAVQALGGFDEALDTGPALPGGGDLDVFYRIVRAGHQVVYDPGYLVFHEHRRDMRGLRRQYRDSWGVAFMAFAVKSFSRDPPMRKRWIALIAWWFTKQGTHLVRSLVGRDPRPTSLILHEVWGGIVGVLGAYGRSRRRIARISREGQ